MLRYILVDRRARRVLIDWPFKESTPFFRVPEDYFGSSDRTLTATEAVALTSPPPDALVFYRDDDHREKEPGVHVYREQEYQPSRQGGAR